MSFWVNKSPGGLLDFPRRHFVLSATSFTVTSHVFFSCFPCQLKCFDFSSCFGVNARATQHKILSTRTSVPFWLFLLRVKALTFARRRFCRSRLGKCNYALLCRMCFCSTLNLSFFVVLTHVLDVFVGFWPREGNFELIWRTFQSRCEHLVSFDQGKHFDLSWQNRMQKNFLFFAFIFFACFFNMCRLNRIWMRLVLDANISVVSTPLTECRFDWEDASLDLACFDLSQMQINVFCSRHKTASMWIFHVFCAFLTWHVDVCSFALPPAGLWNFPSQAGVDHLNVYYYRLTCNPFLPQGKCFYFFLTAISTTVCEFWGCFKATECTLFWVSFSLNTNRLWPHFLTVFSVSGTSFDLAVSFWPKKIWFGMFLCAFWHNFDRLIVFCFNVFWICKLAFNVFLFFHAKRFGGGLHFFFCVCVLTKFWDVDISRLLAVYL